MGILGEITPKRKNKEKTRDRRPLPCAKRKPLFMGLSMSVWLVHERKKRTQVALHDALSN